MDTILSTLVRRRFPARLDVKVDERLHPTTVGMWTEGSLIRKCTTFGKSFLIPSACDWLALLRFSNSAFPSNYLIRLCPCHISLVCLHIHTVFCFGPSLCSVVLLSCEACLGEVKHTEGSCGFEVSSLYYYANSLARLSALLASIQRSDVSADTPTELSKELGIKQVVVPQLITILIAEQRRNEIPSL